MGSTSSKTLAATLVAALMVLCYASATILFEEQFDSMDGWITSSHKDDYGKVALGTGAHVVDPKVQQGLQLTEDNKFYAVSKKLATPISNAKKDVVVSFSVKEPEAWRCGGSYIKLLTDTNTKDFNGDSEYWLMFGPDRCGGSPKLHVILHHDGKNHLWNKMMETSGSVPADEVTHTYTLHITPENKYAVYLDGEPFASGTLEDDWEMLPPRTVPDPSDVKPDTWVDEPTKDDPTATKPADWDDNVERTIPDPDATKPEDWDDEEDGDWEAPLIPNPAYKGPWRAPKIANPDYKGPWIQKSMANPLFKEDPSLYEMQKPVAAVGIDVWRVEAGTVFDNILIGDNLAEILDKVKKTQGVYAHAEKELQATALNAAGAKAEEKMRDDLEAKREMENAEMDEGDL